ncbi:hypothetical protein HHK36_006321 [Tetracentron sinense]|uniref:Uncharacterized protein n=1 Tax=Tetracentron sinense TaxID=13715 RepID=A0A835DP35_TETSI|nr:hypothetical protein HHK36_006321 [Tetracentron sinense]
MDDHSGWDWPEGFSAAGALVKCKATVPNMSNSSDMFQLVDSFGGIARSEQPCNDFVFPKNHHTGHSVFEKSVNKVMNNAQQMNAQEGHNVLLKSLIGNPCNNLPALAKSKIMECPMSGGLATSKSVLDKGRQDGGYQSICDYIELITKGGNPFISNSSLGSVKALGTDSDVSRFNSSKEAFIVDTDAMASNIELRLGQPSQQSRTLGGSVLSALGPRVFDALDDAQKSLSQEHLIHNTVNPRVIEESRQNLQCAPSDTSSPNRKEKQIRLNLMHHALGANNAINTAKLEQFRGDMGKSLPISMFSSHVGTPTVGSIQSQATNNIFNGSEHFMPRILHGESHIAKCDPIDFPWNRSDGTERQLNINGPGLYNYLGKGKGARCDSDGTYVAAKSDFAFHNKMGDSSSFNGFIGGRCLPIGSAVHEKQSDYFSQLSGMPSDASNGSNPFNQSGKNSCVGSSGRLGHGFLSSVSSFPVTAGPVLPLPAVSMGLSSATSISRPNLTPTFSNKEGSDLRPHLLDENLRFLALKHISELSKREHAITSFEMNPEQGRLNSSSDKEMRTKGFVENPLASEEPMQGSYLPIKKDASEIAIESLQSCSTCCKGGIEKLAAVAGLNWCNLSASTQGILLHSKECDIQCPPYHDPLMDKHPSRRLGRNENNTTASGEHDKCCQKEQNTCFPGKCSCAVHSKCLARSYISIGEPSLDACKGDVGSVDGKDSMLVASIFDKGHIIPGDKAITIDQFKKLRGLIPMKTDYRAAQWRDVPTKVMGVHSATCIKRPAKVLNTKGNVDDQLADTAAKRLNGTPQEAESFKEQQMSNACSGFSAPAVTEVSVEVNNMDSCTIDTGDTRYVNDLVVDEGSGIEKCWSSDDALDSERSAEFLGVTGKIDSTKEASSSALPYQSSRDLSDEVKLRNSFKLKKVRNQLHAGCTVHEKINHTQQFERDLKAGRRKRALKWKRLDASVPASGLSSVRYESFKSTGNTELHSHASKEAQIPCRPVQEMPQTCAIYSAGPSSLKRKWSVLSSAKTLSRKRDLHRLDNHNREWENDYQTQSDDDVNCLKLPKLSRENKLKRHWTADLSKQFLRQEMNHADGDKAAKYKPVGCHKNLSRHQVNICDKKTRPVVRGKLGIISNGKLPEDIEKPAKIVSLRTILKTAKRCTISESEEPKLTSTLETKKTTFRRSGGCYNELSISKKGRGNDGNAINNETEPCTSMIGTKEACFSGDKVCVYELSMLEKERDEGCRNFSMLQGFSSARLKPRFKEARKRSLFELTVKGKNPSSAKVSLTKISKCALQAKCRYKGKSYLKDTEDSKCHRNGLYQVNAQKSIKEHKCQGFISDSDAFCCVCGSSNKDEINFLLECGQCLIRVCVLCGYEGGAMTRAVRSRNIVKGLLKAWNILTESKSKKSIPFSETLPDELNVVGASRFGHEADSISLLRPVNIEQSPSAVWELDLQYQMDVVTNSNGSPCNLQVCNSVTAGVLDSTVTQWVHMVCGLWTPGTRCPNVDTMSAFDVSGASRPGENVVSADLLISGIKEN